LPDKLPLFPLRGCILLPRASLPLNIFEPRYLSLVDDILGGERLLGLIQPATFSGEGASLPGNRQESPADRDWPLRKTGCIGRITGFNEQDGGRLAIILGGVCRFGVLSEIESDKPYRIANITLAGYENDLLDEEDDNKVDRNHLLALLRAYLDANGLDADWRSIHRSSTGALVNMLCIHSPWGEEEKQALLEAPDLLARAEILMALAEMELAGKGGGGMAGGGALQ
jgi:Lon protease-like protein